MPPMPTCCNGSTPPAVPRKPVDSFSGLAPPSPPG